MSRRSALQAVLASVAVAYGLAAEIVATRHGQATTFVGSSHWAVGLELIAGWALVAAGLATWLSAYRLEVPARLVVVARAVVFSVP